MFGYTSDRAALTVRLDWKKMCLFIQLNLYTYNRQSNDTYCVAAAETNASHYNKEVLEYKIIRNFSDQNTFLYSTFLRYPETSLYNIFIYLRYCFTVPFFSKTGKERQRERERGVGGGERSRESTLAFAQFYEVRKISII